MQTLFFERFNGDAQGGTDERYRIMARVIEQTYETGGPCTHIAWPCGTGEVVFAFPLQDSGERFVAVLDPQEQEHILRHRDIRNGCDEFTLQNDDRSLEDEGVPTGMSLF